MNQHVEEIIVNDVGGIKGRFSLSVDRPAPGQGSAVLILGANGTGKSSIADGLEFCLRGVLSRRGTGGVKIKRELKNHYVPGGGPSVEIRMTDGADYYRGYGRAPEGAEYLARKNPVPGFDIAPIVLRWRDVEDFWRVDSSQRQGIFFDYFRPSGGAYLNESDREARIAELARADREVAAAWRNLLPYRQAWKVPMPTSVPAAESFAKYLQRGVRFSGGKEERRARLVKIFQDSLLRRNISAAAGVEAASQKKIDREKLQEVLSSVADRVVKSFKTVSLESSIEDVVFDVDSDAGIEITISAHGFSGLQPAQVLSEAHLDLFALLILTEVHVECAARGQSRILVLDDIFQSVDRGMRIRVLDHLSERLKGWQVFITLHDPLWLEISRRAFSGEFRITSVELRKRGNLEPPLVLQARSDLLRDTRHAVEANGSAALVVGAAGRALEGILEIATQSLRTPIRRKLDDRYSINDLWQPLMAQLDTLSDEPDAESVVASIESKRYLRNHIGAHYSVDADGFTDEEAADFVEIVTRLYRLLFCQTCERPKSSRSLSGGHWALVAGDKCKHLPANNNANITPSASD